jgi:hypothetical protein
MKTLILRFVKDERGVTAIEYGLIATLIAVAIITSRHDRRHQSDHEVHRHCYRSQVRWLRSPEYGQRSQVSSGAASRAPSADVPLGAR